MRQAGQQGQPGVPDTLTAAENPWPEGASGSADEPESPPRR